MADTQPPDAPSWGVLGNPYTVAVPSLPSPWTSNTVGFYYVTSGGVNAGQGYPGSPRAQIPVNPPAGSVIVVAGDYTQNHSNPNGLDLRGTEADPIFVIPADGSAFISGRLSFAGTSAYIFFEVPVLYAEAAEKNIPLDVGVDHLCFRNATFQGPGSTSSTSAASAYNSGVFIVAAPSGYGSTHQLVWYNCTITKGGNLNFIAGDPDGCGISLGGTFIEDVWVEGCEFSYHSGNAVIVGAGTTGSEADNTLSRRIMVQNCHVHDVAQQGLWTKRSSDVFFFLNDVHAIRRDCPSTPDSACIGGQYGPRNLWIYGNILHDAQCGVAINGNSLSGGATTTPVYVVGNIAYDIHDVEGTSGTWRSNLSQQGGCAFSIWGSTEGYVINNTIDDYDVGVICPNLDLNINCVGNIFTNRNEGVSGGQIIIHSDPGGASELSNSIYTGACYIREAAGTIWTNVASITKGVLNISTAPDYADAPARNYELLVGSAGINQSVDHAIYAQYLSDYGQSLAVDMNGVVRPQDGGWDMGALETPAGSETLNITTLNATTLTVG